MAEARENGQVCISKKASRNKTSIRLFTITESNERKWKATLQGTEDVSARKCNVLICLFVDFCLFGFLRVLINREIYIISAKTFQEGNQSIINQSAELHLGYVCVCVCVIIGGVVVVRSVL